MRDGLNFGKEITDEGNFLQRSKFKNKEFRTHVIR